MTIYFSDEEKKWIDKIPFDWKIKKECPQKIKKELQIKLNLLKKPQGQAEERK